MADASLDRTLRNIGKAVGKLEPASSAHELSEQLRLAAQEARRFPKWLSLEPVFRKLVDEPEEFDDILQLILTAALLEIRGLEEGSIYQVEILGTPRRLVQLRKMIKGTGQSVGISTVPSRYRVFMEGDGSAASLTLSDGVSLYISNCSSDDRYKPYASGTELSSLACIPVSYGGIVMAVMCVHSTARKHTWTNDDERYLETLARIAANSIGANHSDLTLLPNRRQMDYIVQSRIDGNSQNRGRGMWLSFMDLDNFKYINREFEHSGGDEVILQFAKVLADERGASGQVFHRHGDEFSILWLDMTREQALAQAKRVTGAVVAFPFSVGGSPVLSRLQSHGVQGITASMGLQQWKDGMDSKELITRADTLSREAKEEGSRQGSIKYCAADASSALLNSDY